jgi:hypothetical protein
MILEMTSSETAGTKDLSKKMKVHFGENVLWHEVTSNSADLQIKIERLSTFFSEASSLYYNLSLSCRMKTHYEKDIPAVVASTKVRFP